MLQRLHHVPQEWPNALILPSTPSFVCILCQRFKLVAMLSISVKRRCTVAAVNSNSSWRKEMWTLSNFFSSVSCLTYGTWLVRDFSHPSPFAASYSRTRCVALGYSDAHVQSLFNLELLLTNTHFLFQVNFRESSHWTSQLTCVGWKSTIEECLLCIRHYGWRVPEKQNEKLMRRSKLRTGDSASSEMLAHSDSWYPLEVMTLVLWID